MVAVKICIGSCCHLRGAEKVVEKFQSLIEQEMFTDRVDLKGSFCMGNCSNKGVVLTVNEESHELEYDKAESFFYKTVSPLLN